MKEIITKHFVKSASAARYAHGALPEEYQEYKKTSTRVTGLSELFGCRQQS
jgi:hypothetical protein